MINAKKYLVGFSILVSAITFSQQRMVSHYPQMYDNQTNVNGSLSKEESTFSAKDELDVTINAMMSDPVLRNANWGIAIYDPKTKKLISSYNETEAFVPASTTKLLTTETAINLLGAKFKWITQLDYSGEIDIDGNLNGNLYIVGSGDPSLGTRKAGSASYTEIITEFVRETAALGIKKINGDIIVENAVFKVNKRDLPANIVWQEVNDYYVPVGSTKNIEPRNEQLIGKSKTFLNKNEGRFFYISPYTNKMVYAEKFEGQNYLETKLPDNPTYLTNLFRASLVKNGIAVSGKVVPRTIEFQPEERFTITAYESPLLTDIMYDTNHRSDNALAEAFLKTVGFQKEGDQTLQTGKDVIYNHLKERGFDLEGLNIADGSGLSRSNKVTPISQVKFLADLMEEPYYKDFFTSLPVGGQSGTLKNMFFGDCYGQVFAKTGTLNKVKALAGYIKTKQGKTLTFSILVNNYSGSVSQVKQKMEEMLDSVVNL